MYKEERKLVKKGGRNENEGERMLRMIMGQAQTSAVIRRILLFDDSYISLAPVLKKKLFFIFEADEYT